MDKWTNVERGRVSGEQEGTGIRVADKESKIKHTPNYVERTHQRTHELDWEMMVNRQCWNGERGREKEDLEFSLYSKQYIN